MITIKELLSKIKYDPKENPKDYRLFYFDRAEDKLESLDYEEIESLEDNHLSIKMIDGEIINIPLHRIRKVEKKGRIIWERPNDSR